MSEFSSKWQKPRTEGLANRIKDKIRSPGPLKPRMEAATRQIQVQIAKLEATSAKLRERDASIFNKVVASMQRHDTAHANMLANELAEVRKMHKMVTQAKLALEQVTLRLSTVQELGDIVSMLSPAMGVIRNVRPGLVSVIPGAEQEIGEISGLLGSILVDAGQLDDSVINFQSANEEADKILAEAGAVAEQKMHERFPDLPELQLPSSAPTETETDSQS
jgi:division protein CdvB (Snf7/Vps24/ESCRT-III family)